MWENDKWFVAWLDDEGRGTDEEPLNDDTLDLLYQAFCAGKWVQQKIQREKKRDRRRRQTGQIIGERA